MVVVGMTMNRYAEDILHCRSRMLVAGTMIHQDSGYNVNRIERRVNYYPLPCSSLCPLSRAQYASMEQLKMQLCMNRLQRYSLRSVSCNMLDFVAL